MLPYLKLHLGLCVFKLLQPHRLEQGDVEQFQVGHLVALHPNFTQDAVHLGLPQQGAQGEGRLVLLERKFRDGNTTCTQIKKHHWVGDEEKEQDLPATCAALTFILPFCGMRSGSTVGTLMCENSSGCLSTSSSKRIRFMMRPYSSRSSSSSSPIYSFRLHATRPQSEQRSTGFPL